MCRAIVFSFLLFFLCSPPTEGTSLAAERAGLLHVTPLEERCQNVSSSIRGSHFHKACHDDTCAMVAVRDKHDYVSVDFDHFESGTRSKILTLLKESPGHAFLDIGANVGVHTFYMATHGFQVIAVEGMPMNNQLLRATLCHPMTDEAVKLRVNLLEISLGAQHLPNGCSVWSHPDNVGNGQISCDGSKPCPECVFLEHTPMETLDRLFASYDHQMLPIKVCKIDIECFEPLLFLGGKHLFKSGLIPHIVMEFNGPLLKQRTGISSTDFLHSLDDLGFDVYLDGFQSHHLPPQKFKLILLQTRDIFLSHRDPPTDSQSLASSARQIHDRLKRLSHHDHSV